MFWGIIATIISLTAICTGAWLGRLGIQAWREREMALVENGKYGSSKEARKREKEMALIEQGLYEPYQRRRSLKSGIIVSSLGVAFTVYSIVTWRGFTIGGYFPDEEGGLLLAGLILLFLGAGLITFHYLTLRERKATILEHNSVDKNS